MAYERYPQDFDPYRRDDGRSDRSDYGYGSQTRDERYARVGDQRAGGAFSDGRSGGYQSGDRYADPRDRYGNAGDRYGYSSDRGRDPYREGRGDQGYGRQPQGYDYNDRGFIARAGDEVRSWFGDEDAERRRDQDARADQRNDRHPADHHYGAWRSDQIAALDRDYDEYRRENRAKFDSEFGAWRTQRQGQRSSLGQVQEHMEVVGSDGAHVGTVDKVRGDRILLTKNDADAGGHHHSIPSAWLESVDTKVTLRKTAQEAKDEWRDEENRSAMLNYGDKTRDRDAERDGGGQVLNRSFSGTY